MSFTLVLTSWKRPVHDGTADPLVNGLIDLIFLEDCLSDGDNKVFFDAVVDVAESLSNSSSSVSSGVTFRKESAIHQLIMNDER